MRGDVLARTKPIQTSAIGRLCRSCTVGAVGGGWADREVDVLSKCVSAKLPVRLCAFAALGVARGTRLSGRSRGGGGMCRLSVRLNGWMKV